MFDWLKSLFGKKPEIEDAFKDKPRKYDDNEQMMELMMAQVKSEHEYIRESKCDCGGNFAFMLQELQVCPEEETMRDKVTAQCVMCKKTKMFYFPLHAKVYRDMYKDMKSKSVSGTVSAMERKI